MKDAEFCLTELINIRNREINFLESKEKTAASINTLYDRTARQLSEVKADADKLIAQLQAKLREAESAKKAAEQKLEKLEKPQTEPDYPQKPADGGADEKQKKAENSKYEAECSKIDQKNARIRENNERINAERARIEGNLKKYEGIISRLNRDIQQMNQLKITLQHAESDFYRKKGIAADLQRKTILSGGEVVQALNGTVNAAENIIRMSDARGAAYVPESVYRLEHKIAGGGSESGLLFSGAFAEAYHGNNAADEPPTETPLDGQPPESKKITALIKERSAERFFAELKTYDGYAEVIVKIPAGNLRALGGDKFMSDMQSAGYTLASDGGVIGSDGKITFIKREY